MVSTNTEISYTLKHQLYERSVQCHESDIEFMEREYKRAFGKAPLILREDFGGTGALACDWVKQGLSHKSYAIDLDPEPVVYGKKNHFSKLNESQKTRVKYIEGNVLDDSDYKVDIVCAFNFSYSIFKERSLLLEYFKKVHEGLATKGAFFIDLFGGTEARTEMVEETEHDDHTYFWDCERYNPITHECLYKIHFKTHYDNKKYDNVFVYDWRLWGLAELNDLLKEAGFKPVNFWEGDDNEGGGDGEFYITETAENCESWVTYIMAVKE